MRTGSACGAGSLFSFLFLPSRTLPLHPFRPARRAMRSGQDDGYIREGVRNVFGRGIPRFSRRRAPSRSFRNSPSSAPRVASAPSWDATHGPARLAARDDAGCPSTFSGLAFGLGLLLGIVMTSIAFSGGIWWFKSKPRRSRNAKRLTINPYAHAPHHIITEATVSPQPTMNMMSSTTHLVSQPTSPRTATVVGRTSSTRSAATTGRLRSSRSESSLPLPVALRDAHGKFSTLEEPPPPPPQPQHQPSRSRQSEVMSMFSASMVGNDAFRTGAHTSFALSAEPSTATAELFPRSPISGYPFSHVAASPHSDHRGLPSTAGASYARSRALSLESLARTAVARDSISSIASTWSSRTRVPMGPPPLPPPASPLPSPPPQDKRLQQLQEALSAATSPNGSASPTSPLLFQPAPHSPLRPLPVPETPAHERMSHMSAREEKAFLSQIPPMSMTHPPPSPTRSVAESSRGRRDTAPPPAYSRPPSRFA
ncbi:hypothetical protein EXIGLDRAFT_313884 [Exidia glandulosa HHB12029]|uniref:Proteophosphoglycan ppg4 n=1 Tax=Exidia glandulosa HHB12029 TaxID=1314781 RepID=A0A165LUI3_EXIGL|nr:hypothetical protein EXIGLDRAFT_313884 [Exidia glandulosa HHB12029]